MVIEKLYYIDFQNWKFRIFKDYISEFQDDSIDVTFNIEFTNGIIRKNTETFVKRRKARQFRDLKNKIYKLTGEK